MKSKRRFIPLAFLGAIIMSLLLIVPAFSATGAVRFYNTTDDDKGDLKWARQGGSVGLEVDDSDLDVDVDLTEEFEAGQTTYFLDPANIPVADRNTDGFVNRNDVTIVGLDDQPITGVTPDRVGPDGRIDFRDAPTVGFKVSYKGAVKNEVEVTVKSQADSKGIPVTLTETKTNSGKFQAEIGTHASGDSTSSSLKVGKNDLITFSYADAKPKGNRAKTLKVETTAPVFSELSPASGSAGRANPEVEFNVTDGDSGIGEDEDDSIMVIFAIDNDRDDDIDYVEPYQVDQRGSLNSIDGGFHARQRLPSNSQAGDDATVYWWALATDAAGNMAVSDSKSKIKVDDKEQNDLCVPDVFSTGVVPDDDGNSALVDNGVGDTSSLLGKCQPYSIQIDNTEPAIDQENTRTGAFWDTSNKDAKDKTNTSPTKAKANMVLVAFDEALNDSTVEADDFEVNDKAPTKAEVFSGNKMNVFLTLGSDLDPNAEPKVEIVGQIEDLAGNRQSSGTVDKVTDGIAPTLTVSVEGGPRPVTKGEVKVMISSNEDVGTPRVVLQKVVEAAMGDDADTDADESLGAVEAVGDPQDAVLTSARTYEATLSAQEPGLYNVYVTANDATSSNQGTAGVNKGPIDLTDDTKAILFEFDNDVGAPTVTPDDKTGSDNSDPFITIDFAAEGTEYEVGTDADGKLIDGDSYGTVTIVSATLKSPDMDAMDIAGSLATTNNSKFLYKASDLAKGNHKVTVKAKDAAGNEEEFSATVKIVEREPFNLELMPGWNLISLPGNPTNSSLNAVIPADHPASTILSYDAESGWTTAIRSDDGTWLGTLMTVDASRAYWIQTDTYESIKVDIPRIGAGTSVPPTIALAEGWNFIPVVDVTGDMSHGDSVSAKGYFSGTKVNRVYSFDTLQGMWEVVDLEKGSLMVGSGYWAHASEAGVLAP